jgi:hypothetical protein
MRTGTVPGSGYIPGHIVGRGYPEDGGGPLRGGLSLMNRFTVDIEDPAVPYDIEMTVFALDEMLACEYIGMTRREGGPVVTSTSIRLLTVDSYLIRARQELERHVREGVPLLLKLSFDNPAMIAYEEPGSAEVTAFREGQRRNGRLTSLEVAEAYREALRSDDPDKSRRPTEAAAAALGYSRGHISRMLTQARREGLPGLGPMRPPRDR